MAESIKALALRAARLADQINEWMNLPRKETNEILFLIVLNIKDEVREVLQKSGPD